jgi:ActR/RegA family two-component response regulator
MIIGMKIVDQVVIAIRDDGTEAKATNDEAMAFHDVLWEGIHHLAAETVGNLIFGKF